MFGTVVDVVIVFDNLEWFVIKSGDSYIRSPGLFGTVVDVVIVFDNLEWFLIRSRDSYIQPSLV